MTSPHAGLARITTVHLVYPHGEGIATPDSIGRNLGRRLAASYRVEYHDWRAHYWIRPDDQAALVGHPHPLPGTVFRASAAREGWGRVLMLAPYNGDPAQVAFENAVIRRCDLFLALTGPYWYERIASSAFAHWAPKMVRLDLAIDRADFPPVKGAVNPPGKRRFVYIGHGARAKNIGYLARIAAGSPGTDFGWIGSDRSPDPRLVPLGWQDFRTEAARSLVGGFDFLITVGRADANPTTILEAMAWGLIPVCSPESGYADLPGIVNVPLDSPEAASQIVRDLQALPAVDLEQIQHENWERLDRDYTWDRFAHLVASAIESSDSPSPGPESARHRAKLALAVLVSAQTSPIRVAASVLGARLRSRARITSDSAR